MKWFFVFLLFAVPVVANAQPKQVVASCGAQTLVAGDGVNGFVDLTGKECVNVSVTTTLPAGASTSANQTTEIGSLATIATNTGASWPAGTNLGGNVGVVYPAGSTPINASATGTTAATTATLAANASLHTYICSLSIRSNATAAATGNATVTGLASTTLNYNHWTAPVASGVGVTEQIFSPCLVSSAANTGIAVISPAPGSGGVVSVTATGYQL